MKYWMNGIIIILLVVTAPALAAEVPTLPSEDALAVSPGGAWITLPQDSRVPEEKISPVLRRQAAALPTGNLPVVVLLHEPPELKSAAAGPQHLAILARLEQDFVERASSAGLVAKRGLSHLPIVLAEVPASALETVAGDPAVRHLDPDLPVRAARVEGAALMHADQLRSQYGATGSGIGVAVLDSGVDATHPELAGQVTAQGNYTDAPGDGTSDVAGHGTAVSGIIAGTSHGMAPQAHLWSLKVLGDDGSGSLGWVISALNDVVANHDSFGGVSVVNMSLGGLGGAGGDQPWTGACDGDIPSLSTAVNSVVNLGITVLASSGNGGCKSGLAWPACLANVISVGAVYDADLGGVSYGEVTCSGAGSCADYVTGAGKVTCYSNSGSQLDVWAPSHCSNTTKTGGGYESCFGGTSASAPYAAGVAAQLYQAVSGLTPAALRSALTTTGQMITDPANGVSKHLVDAVAAYQQLSGSGGGGGGGGGGGSNESWLEWVVHASGSGGSQWRSDVGFLNTGSSQANVTFTVYLSTGETLQVPASAPVPAGAQAWYADVLGQLGRTGKGSMKVSSDQPGVVTARLYNESSGGTYGQFFDGHQAADGLSAGQSATLPMLRQDGTYRTNISVTNTGASSASVSVNLYNAYGSSVGVLSRTLQPGESYQWLEPLASAGVSGAAWATVRVTSGSGVIASGSVIDGRTGDPTTIPMKR